MADAEEIPDLARLAYEAWCQLLPGQPHARWGQVPQRVRRAWQGVVMFVVLTERAGAGRRREAEGRAHPLAPAAGSAAAKRARAKG